ncbi:MAG: hypothetical protein CM15mV47_330 [uncultured marine virus]|nr:MAG: hypothetical protein CM15mV47_330 [uncultured marine virus]
MSNLHLSLAHASGLAPLIYMQVHQGKNIKMLDLTRRGSLDSVFAAMSQEEQVYKGMDTLLNLFTRRLDQRGIQLDSNEPLQKLLVSIEDTVTRGKDNVNLKKQELDKLLTQFYLNAEELDENSINKIINLKTLLLPEEIRGQVDTAKMVAQVSLEIAEGARSDAIALRELSATMPEQVVLDKVRPIADKMFSTELGRERH